MSSGGSGAGVGGGLPTTIAAANVAIVHDKQANLRRFEELIEDAQAQGAGFLVLPEVGLQGYADLGFLQGTRESAEVKQYYFREAETIPGPATERIGELAARTGVTVQLGLAESVLDGNVIYNSVAVIGPEGLIGSYRKIHNQFEYPYFSPANEPVTVELGFARAGLLICWDFAFPELGRHYGLRGADLLSVSTAWPLAGHDPATDYHGFAMDIALQAQALFNQAWVIVSNHCEQGAYHDGATDSYGASQIVDPFGKVVAKAGQQEGLVLHTADIRGEVLRARTEGLFGKNFLQDRRPECYGLGGAAAGQGAPAAGQSAPGAGPA